MEVGTPRNVLRAMRIRLSSVCSHNHSKALGAIMNAHAPLCTYKNVLTDELIHQIAGHHT